MRLPIVALVAALVIGVESTREELYAKRQKQCDLFVSPDGSDNNSGITMQEPLETLGCALDPACADVSVSFSQPSISYTATNPLTSPQSGDVVCLLAGVYSLDDTVFCRLKPESSISIFALGEDGSAILDGNNWLEGGRLIIRRCIRRWNC